MKKLELKASEIRGKNPDRLFDVELMTFEYTKCDCRQFYKSKTCPHLRKKSVYIRLENGENWRLEEGEYRLFQITATGLEEITF